jgi:predicted ATP-dependent endonuclease of OLD family
MRLKEVVLDNFRGYRAATRIPVHPQVTGIIGRNDVGKSTILESLEIFFNHDAVKLEKDDIPSGSRNVVVEITCVFDQLPPDVVVDESFRTSLRQEHLLNSNGELEIIKRFKVGAAKVEEKVFVRAMHPTITGLNNLLELKITDLRALAERRNVLANVTDQRVSSLLRAALWASASDLNLQTREIEIAKFEEAGKNIWGRVEALLPVFALFKSDRESSDGDAEAKDPMQAAVKNAQKEFQSEISILENRIIARVLDVACRTLAKLNEMDSTLSRELTPKFREKPKWTFNFGLDCEDGIPVNKRGSGVRRLILLNFFRAEAERTRTAGQSVIYAIEEPETSQHPNNQVMLIKALLDMATSGDCQVMLSTHVPALGGLLPTDAVRYIERLPDRSVRVSYGTEEVLAKVALALGVLPEKELSFARAIIAVEGYGDVIALRHASNKLKENGNLSHSLDEKKIVPVFIGGCGSLKHWVTLKTAEELGLPWGVFIDSDRGGANVSTHRTNVARITDLRSKGVRAHATRKREFENYLHADAIQRATGIQVAFSDTDDVKKLVNQTAQIAESEVLAKIFPQMTATEILRCDRYTGEQGEDRHELVEVLNDLLGLC